MFGKRRHQKLNTPDKGKERIWKPSNDKFKKFDPIIAYEPKIKRVNKVILYCSDKRRIEYKPLIDNIQNRKNVKQFFGRYRMIHCGTRSVSGNSNDPATISFYRNLRNLNRQRYFVAYGLSINMFIQLLGDFQQTHGMQFYLSHIIITNQLKPNEIVLSTNKHHFLPANTPKDVPWKIKFNNSQGKK